MMKFQKLLVANRSEIAIRVFRSAHELGIRTVAIYAYEDRNALHRLKADEAYQIGRPGEPIRSYLDIDGIVALARHHGVDAIHPGYGFLSENPELARACDRGGIRFVGPQPEALERFGDKTSARKVAQQVGVPVLGGTDAISDIEEGEKLAAKIGYPVILKAAKGGGGRGMRVVREPAGFQPAFEQAQRESQTAFGSPEIFLEKYISNARHLEVQLLGDMHGNLVHLYERDCSIQRRHQKVVEIAPAPNLDPAIRSQLCEAAVAIGQAVNYQNAGTVEFLYDADAGQFFFIEVNPRIQVEHTVTEEITGIDLVRKQILVAEGYPLDHPDIGFGSQDKIVAVGYALQCRVTTEDASNQFLPDYGRITAYRSASGMGIRLDAGTAFGGAVVNPFYDSLLVKVTARGRLFKEAASRMERCLQEFRIRGVKTNIPFLIRVVTHPRFLASDVTTRFIDETPELFDFPQRQDRATRILTYIADVIVNENPLVKGRPRSVRRIPAIVPAVDASAPPPTGTRDRLKQQGPEKFAQWVLDQKPLLMTDTTFRDAHQSLLATRIRTQDLLNIAEVYATRAAGFFSLEMWGGATFDSALRFLKECPWQRLAELRERIPNILFQMLLRASNAVGYTNYPDNIVQSFVEEAAQAGIDVFRVFDALNWTKNMRVAMDAVRKSGAICEAAICYTGDILNPGRPKYDLKYYVQLAVELEKMGAQFLAIKDMSGLCKPYAARRLVQALKQEVGIPIHFHTHDTAGVQAASILEAAESQLDIADAAFAPLAGGTSQPNLNTVVEALRFTPRDTGLDAAALDEIAVYWQGVREFYTPFESEVLPATSSHYRYEMPGGQYTNLFEQARALGLADRWGEVCEAYCQTNQMLGDIVKVTPTSKAVGDMALFLVANNLTADEVLNTDRELAFPASVIDLISGRMGQPPGGFPEPVKDRVLRGEPAFDERPGASLPPADFAAAAKKVEKLLGRQPNRQEVVTHLLYPKVFEEFLQHQDQYSDTSHLPTPAFFYGLQPGEEISVEIEKGKTLIVRYLTQGDPHPDGTRTVFFEMNGQPRDVTVTDHSLEVESHRAVKADPGNPHHIGASMPGMVVTIAVQPGDEVTKGQKLLTMEAMKMEATVYAERDGRVVQLLVSAGSAVETGDLLLVLDES
jgi:pyruvate carboxylase